MSKASDVELVRNGYEAFGKGDMASLDHFFSDEITFHIPGSHPLSGDVHSKKDVFAFLGQLNQRSSRTYQVDVHDVIAGQQRVVVLVTERGEANGRTLSLEAAHVWRIEDDRAVELWNLCGDQPNADRFWS